MRGTLLLAGLVFGAVAFDGLWRGWHRSTATPAWQVLVVGDPRRGRQAIQRHGCGACHVVPGIRGAVGRVGPQLGGLRDQIFLAGTLANTPPNLARWVRDPQSIQPGSAMPDLGVGFAESHDIAAYLYENP